MTDKKRFVTVDEYIQSFPPNVQSILERLRQTIYKIIPQADETISYAIPTFKLNGRYIVYFAAWQHHISLYPIPAGDAAFQKEIMPFQAGRGTVKFRLDKPIPYALVGKIVRLLLKENLTYK